MSTEETETRLEHLRGAMAPKSYDARKIAALGENPGCGRRAVLDAAGVDKAQLVGRLGWDGRYGQSPFAIGRGNSFEAMVKEYGCAEIITLLRGNLNVPVAQAMVEDLNPNPAGETLRSRSTRTAHLLDRVATDRDARTIMDHPVLTLDIAGTSAHLEPDAITHLIGGKFYVVEIKSFAAIDGQADPGQVAQATKQAAVYSLALRRMLANQGHDPELVADRYLLVCPKDFSNRPFGSVVDLRQQRDCIEHHLRRLRRIEDLLTLLDDDASFDVSAADDGAPATPVGRLEQSVASLPYAYRPSCLANCELAMFCRDEATRAGEPARLGSAVKESLPGVDSTDTVQKMLDGLLPVHPHHEEVVDELRAARILRTQRLRSVA